MMVDLTWLSQEANQIHGFFTSLFYVLVTVLLLLGVLIEYFKLPLGFMPGFAPLVGRVLIATILLHTYPEVSHTLADLTDALANRLGNLNQFKLVLDRMGDKLGEFSWSWVSIKGSIVLALSFLTFFGLYFSVHVMQAFLIYTWTILFVFSPILIALFVLPQTAAATGALYRSLIEASCWKVVWAVIATLLWSTGATDLYKDAHVITAICFNLVLAGSLLVTPMVVHALAGAGVASMTKSVGAIAVGGIATVTPAKVLKLGSYFAKQGVNQSLNAGALLTSHHFPRAHQLIQQVPRFRMPKRAPLFEPRNEISSAPSKSPAPGKYERKPAQAKKKNSEDKA